MKLTVRVRHPIGSRFDLALMLFIASVTNAIFAKTESTKNNDIPRAGYAKDRGSDAPREAALRRH
jgi:hypothetical protein